MRAMRCVRFLIFNVCLLTITLSDKAIAMRQNNPAKKTKFEAVTKPSKLDSLKMASGKIAQRRSTNASTTHSKEYFRSSCSFATRRRTYATNTTQNTATLICKTGDTQSTPFSPMRDAGDEYGQRNLDHVVHTGKCVDGRDAALTLVHDDWNLSNAETTSRGNRDRFRLRIIQRII